MTPRWERSAWPFAGRGSALRDVTEALLRPDLGGAVVLGAPGAGRSRLAVEAHQRLASGGHAVFWATGTRSASAVPLGALLHLGRDHGEIVARLCEPSAARAVLVVDDAHLLDSASAALLLQLAVHTPAAVLATVRRGVAVPDAVTALWKERVARRVELGPLADGEVRALLERGLAGPLDSVTSRTLRALAAGNPLFLRELVQAGLESGTLRRVHGLWHLAGEPRVTGRLGDLVEVGDPGVLDVLEVLACAVPAGAPLCQTAVEALTGPDALVRAERSGLVAVRGGGVGFAGRERAALVGFVVPGHAAVIRERMPRSRLRAIHAGLAATGCHLASDPLVGAAWREHAGLGSSAPHLLAAAQCAASRLDAVTAEQLARAARELYGQQAPAHRSHLSRWLEGSDGDAWPTGSSEGGEDRQGEAAGSMAGGEGREGEAAGSSEGGEAKGREAAAATLVGGEGRSREVPGMSAGLEAKWREGVAASVGTGREAAGASVAGEGGRREVAGGLEAELALAEALAAQGRHAEAAAVLPSERLPGEAEGRRVMLAERLDYWWRGVVPVHPDGPAAAQVVRTWAILLEGRVPQTLGSGPGLLMGALPASARAWAASAVTIAAGLAGDTALVDRASTAPHPAEAGDAALVDRASTGPHPAEAESTALVDRASAPPHPAPAGDSASPWAKVQVGGARCLALLLAGALDEAGALAEAASLHAADHEPPQVVGAWAAVWGIVAKHQGRLHVAQHALREAVVLLDGPDPLRLRRVLLAELAGAYAMTGDTLQAERWMRRADACPPPPGVLFDAWIERDRAWTASLLDLPTAATHALAAAKAARTIGAPMLEVLALTDAARFGAAGQVRDRFTELAAGRTVLDQVVPEGRAGSASDTPGRRQTGPVVEALAGAVAALAEQDAARLARAAERLRALGHLLPAAECAATAYRLHTAASRPVDAKPALALARELLTECDGARTPLTDLSGSRSTLTPRELQVAKLIAAGMPGRSVAVRLGLSLRTVNNHLGRVYVKLGISGRDALTAVLDDTG